MGRAWPNNKDNTLFHLILLCFLASLQSCSLRSVWHRLFTLPNDFTLGVFIEILNVCYDACACGIEIPICTVDLDDQIDTAAFWSFKCLAQHPFKDLTWQPVI